MADAKSSNHDANPAHPPFHGTHEGVIQVLREMASDVIHGTGDSHSFVQRTRIAVCGKAPKLKDALRHTSSDIVRWMHKGGPWRAFLVTSVGIILLLGLTGLGAFMLFFVAATANAVAIGFLVSAASVGAFTALFFTSLTAIYIGALVVAVVTISTITFFSICAALTAAGWIAFFWVLWQGVRKGVDVFRGSVLMTVSALTAVSSPGSRQIIAVEKKPY